MEIIKTSKNSNLVILKSRIKENLLDYYIPLLDLKHDEYNFNGKKVVSPRLISFMSNEIPFYVYSRQIHHAVPIDIKTKALLSLITDNFNYNGILFNLYRNGNDSISWHSDDEVSINQQTPIVSISFGETRTFKIKDKLTKEMQSVRIENGDVIIMNGKFQEECQHMIPKESANGMRLNLTFREYYK